MAARARVRRRCPAATEARGEARGDAVDDDVEHFDAFVIELGWRIVELERK
jgi:hypothetical protein